MKSFAALCATACILCLSALNDLGAATIVQFNSTTYVTSATVLFSNMTAGTSNSSATGNFGGFSSGNPMQLSPSASYSGPLFYGQVNWTTRLATGTGNTAAMVNNAAGDRMEFKQGYTNLAELILFKQADFLAGLNTGNVGFDSTSSISLNINTFAAIEAGRVVIRLQGGSNDGYYISSTAPFDGTGTKTVPNLTALTWLAYDPATNLRTFGAPVNLLEGGVIPHVTEVGFFAQNAASVYTGGGTDITAFRLDTITVNAIAIPEPSVAGLVALSLGGLLLRRKRAA